MSLNCVSDGVVHEAIAPSEVERLSSNEGFPYLVIEFFKKNIRKIPSPALTKRKRKLNSFLALPTAVKLVVFSVA
jgi:hypothetical protein